MLQFLQRNLWIAYLCLFWSALYLCDFIFKKLWISAYHRYITGNGLHINLCRLQWYTKVFNSLFVRLANIKPKLLDIWFDVGVVVTLVCGLGSVILLVVIPVNTLLRSQKADDQILKPVIPGVNLPRSDVIYYVVTLFISAVLHELGHAVAAVRANVKVNGFGIFMLFMYPGAYVDLHTETLFAASSWQQLKIFCGGVWHNLVLSVTAFLVLLSLPTLLTPFYSIHENVVIVSHSQDSMVAGDSGLFVGDIITHLDGCTVNSVSDWVSCLSISLQSNRSVAYRLPSHKDYQHESVKSPLELSSENCVCSQLDICYNIINEYPSPAGSKMSVGCLRAREVIGFDTCPELGPGCIYPYIGHLDESTKLIVIRRMRAPPVLFYGHPVDLHQSVILGEVLPKTKYSPFFLPYTLENLFKYFISLSSALAILNVVPCYALDGQHIAKALLELILPRIDPDNRELVFTLSVLLGTLLIAVNVLLAMYILFLG